jgi:hypothetical protein
MFLADCVANVLSIIAALVVAIIVCSCVLLYNSVFLIVLIAQANFLMPLPFGWSLFGLLFFGPLGA